MHFWGRTSGTVTVSCESVQKIRIFFTSRSIRKNNQTKSEGQNPEEDFTSLPRKKLLYEGLQDSKDLKELIKTFCDKRGLFCKGLPLQLKNLIIYKYYIENLMEDPPLDSLTTCPGLKSLNHMSMKT